MEELLKDGPVFDSFSESNSRESSVRGGGLFKGQPLPVTRLNACLEGIAEVKAAMLPAQGEYASFCVWQRGICCFLNLLKHHGHDHGACRKALPSTWTSVLPLISRIVNII